MTDRHLASTPAPLLVDSVEAARILGGISTKTLARLATRGELHPVRLGRRVLWSVAELERYVAAACGQGGSRD